MENKTKKKLIIVTICVALVLIIAVSSVLYFVLRKKNNSQEEEEPISVNQSYSSAYEYINCSNESILRRIISTSNYNGEYTLSSLISIDFNENLSEENIYQLYSNYGVRDSNSFKQFIFEKRKALSETFSITRYLDASGNVLNYATFVASSASYGKCSGDVFGDDDLALVVLSEDSDNNFFISNSDNTFYISLNYTPSEHDTVLVTDQTSNITYIYVFEDVYSSNNKSLRLFTVTYAYALKVNSNSVSNDDMVI